MPGAGLSPAAPRLRHTLALLQRVSRTFSRLPWPLKIGAALVAALMAPLCMAVLAGALFRDLMSRPWHPAPPAAPAAAPPGAQQTAVVQAVPAVAGPQVALQAAPDPIVDVALLVRPPLLERPALPPPSAAAASLVAPSMDAWHQGHDWQVIDLRSADRLGAYAYEHGVVWDVGSLQALSREGGFVWRDILASGASAAALEAAARSQLEVDPCGTSRKVLALVWHLMEHGVEKNQGFGEGAFTCADPDQQLGAFLRGVGYARISSHLTHDGGDTFGIDIVGQDIGLPAHHRHVLCKIYRGPDGQMRLFIKPEAWGVRGLVAFAGHSLDYLISLARKMSPVFGSDTEPGMRKERIPQKLLAEYVWHIAGLPGAEENLARVGRSGRGQGIAAMQAFLREQLAQPEVPRASAAVLRAFLNRLTEAYDHLDVRIGSEVVVEMPGVAPAP